MRSEASLASATLRNAQVSKMKFQEHGFFSINTHGSIVHAQVKGGLNQESIAHCVNDLGTLY